MIGEMPKNLEEQELSELFKKYEEGDKKARKMIIEHNLGLVYLVLKKVIRYPFLYDMEDDDLFSVGCIGLIKAVDTYQMGKNYKFSTYAVKVISNEIFQMIRDKVNPKRYTKYMESLSEGTEVNFENIGNGEFENDLVNRLTKDNYMQKLPLVLNKLSEKERIVICHYYGVLGYKKMTQNELKEELELTQATISRIKTRALVKIKNGFNHLD